MAQLLHLHPKEALWSVDQPLGVGALFECTKGLGGSISFPTWMCRAQHLGRVGFWVPINGIWFSAHAFCSLSVETPMSLGEVKLGNAGLERSRAGDSWWDPPDTWHLHPKRVLGPFMLAVLTAASWRWVRMELGESWTGGLSTQLGGGFPQFPLLLVKHPKIISKSWVIAFFGVPK